MTSYITSMLSIDIYFHFSYWISKIWVYLNNSKTDSTKHTHNWSLRYFVFWCIRCAFFPFKHVLKMGWILHNESIDFCAPFLSKHSALTFNFQDLCHAHSLGILTILFNTDNTTVWMTFTLFFTYRLSAWELHESFVHTNLNILIQSYWVEFILCI